MLANLEDLLDEINIAPTGREQDFNSIVDVFLKKGVPKNEIEDLIDAAWRNLLIKSKYHHVKETQKDDAHAPKDIKFILNIPGFEFLNQIRIKETIKQLDSSIKNFNASSNKYSKKIEDSIT